MRKQQKQRRPYDSSCKCKCSYLASIDTESKLSYEPSFVKTNNSTIEDFGIIDNNNDSTTGSSPDGIGLYAYAPEGASSLF